MDKRCHIGGNVYTEEIEGIQVHKYGAHIFHTNNKQVWEYETRFAEFNRYTNSPVANYYMNVDLYRYWIGRPDQSVQEEVMKKRYHHQILVTEKCFTACHLDDIPSKKLRKHLHHELFMMFGISILFTRLNKTAETDAALDRMWDNCIAFDPKWGRHFRDQTLLWFICRPGKLGQDFSEFIYRLCNKIVRFN